MGYSRCCSAHTFPRQSCDDCTPVRPSPKEVPAERLLSMKLRYALRGDDDRAPFRARSVTEILDEIIGESRGDVA